MCVGYPAHKYSIDNRRNSGVSKNGEYCFNCCGVEEQRPITSVAAYHGLHCSIMLKENYQYSSSRPLAQGLSTI
jgi:hypothetical protein